jgi:hypothetical protein
VVSSKALAGSKMTKNFVGYLISWSQTTVEGLKSPPVAALETGLSWAWRGEPIALDPPRDGRVLVGADDF